MMMFDITDWCYSLIVCSGLLCLLKLLIPDDCNKSIIETGGACVLFLLALSPFTEVEFENLFSEIMTYSEQIHDESELLLEKNQELSKSIIERKYAEYIINEAKQMGIKIQSAFVSVNEDVSGNWIPDEVIYVSTEAVPDSFKEYIWLNLGVPKERQFTQ